MPSRHADNSDSADERLGEIIADYVRAVENGAAPDREKVLTSHPELAEELREFFEHRDRIELMIDPLRKTLEHVLNVRCPHCHNAIELLNEARVTSIGCPSCGSSFSLLATPGEALSQKPKQLGQFKQY